MFQVAVFVATLYLLVLGALAFAFKFVAGSMLPKLVYIYLGTVGTIFLIVSLGYTFRKHYLKNLTPRKTWLDLHILTGTLGSFIILLHSEFHFRALVPALALISLQLVVVSGVVGKFLIAKLMKKISQEQERDKAAKAKKELAEAEGMGESKQGFPKIEDDLMVLVFSASIMKRWRMVHIQLTPIPIILTVMHVISEFYYRGIRL